MFTAEEIQEVNEKTLSEAKWRCAFELQLCTERQVAEFGAKYPRGIGLSDINDA